jgi:hypothetical protein
MPPERAERWQLLERLLREWVRPLGPADGLSPQLVSGAERKLGFRLPAALREAYLLLGGADELTSRANILVPPPKLKVEDRRLVIWRENQDVGRWGVSLSSLRLEDPPVEFDKSQLFPDAKPRWVRQDPTLSEFVIHMVIHDMFLLKQDRLCANGAVEARTLLSAARNWRRLPFADWDWPCTPTVFYEGFGCLLVENCRSWLWLSAKNESSFQTALKGLEQLRIRLDLD